jgi:hypothetical protein
VLLADADAARDAPHRQVSHIKGLGRIVRIGAAEG